MGDVQEEGGPGGGDGESRGSVLLDQAVGDVDAAPDIEERDDGELGYDSFERLGDQYVHLGLCHIYTRCAEDQGGEVKREPDDIIDFWTEGRGLGGQEMRSN